MKYKLQVGDPVVFRHEKFRVSGFLAGGTIMLRMRFGGKGAIVKPEDLVYDPVAGVWRAHD